MEQRDFYEENAKKLLHAVTVKAITDYVAAIRDGDQKVISSCETYLSMKNDAGEFIFPFSKIKFNAYKAYYEMMIKHLENLPDYWYEGCETKSHQPDRSGKLTYECPMCLQSGDHNIVYPSYRVRRNDYFEFDVFAHRCKTCGFVVWTDYGENDSETVRRKKICAEANISPFRKKLFDLVRANIEASNLQAKEKAEKIKAERKRILK